MNQPAEAPKALIDKSRVSPERIRYFATADESIVEEIQCGVLFVMAYWSAPAVLAFVKLTEVLARCDPEAKLTFVVIDTDGVPALYEHAEFIGGMFGMGETAWIKDGRIVNTSLADGPECFYAYTKELLSLCAGVNS